MSQMHFPDLWDLTGRPFKSFDFILDLWDLSGRDPLKVYHVGVSFIILNDFLFCDIFRVSFLNFFQVIHDFYITGQWFMEWLMNIFLDRYNWNQFFWIRNFCFATWYIWYFPNASLLFQFLNWCLLNARSFTIQTLFLNSYILLIIITL
jgi:hypothetical protein